MLFAAGTLGGIFSTVVSIASLVTYPVLLALGVPPLSANMTNTVSLVLTGAGERGEECCFWDGECHGRCMLRVVR